MDFLQKGMKTKPQSSFDEEFDELVDTFGHVAGVHSLTSRQKAKKASTAPAPGVRDRAAQDALSRLGTEDESRENLNFSYQASRHEAGWLRDSLGEFYEHRWFDDVLRLVKGGKEANVYLCAANPTSGVPWLAAKVYRPRMLRNLRKDHIYREGRTDLDSSGRVIEDDGLLHAMRKRSTLGLELLHASWIEHEYQTLLKLHAAGADSPRPFARGHNAILMGYVGDAVTAAPTLNSVDLPRRRVRPLFDRVVHNLEILLACRRIHGDLSAFNILYWEEEITLIDFPQAIDPEQNPSAYGIFVRDVTRMCQYFQEQGLRVEPRALAGDLWRKAGYRRSPQVDLRYLNAEDAADRGFWEQVRKEEEKPG